MAKEKKIIKSKPIFSGIFRFTVWITSILVSLAVGFGMAHKTLTIPFLSWNDNLITVIAGWIVIVFTLFNVILSFIEK
jgi:hypothetical protein